MSLKTRAMQTYKDWFEPEEHDIWFYSNFFKNSSAKTVRKKIYHLLKYLNTPDKKFYDKFIHGWMFYERNTGRSGVHVHALIKGIDVSHAGLLRKKCCRELGRSGARDVHFKVGKYVAKKFVYQDSVVDFHPFKINSKLRK